MLTAPGWVVCGVEDQGVIRGPVLECIYGPGDVYVF